MQLLNTPAHHGLVSRALHWVVVAGIVAQWLLAEGDEIRLHQSIGMLLLLLAVLRLIWRFANPVPAWPADIRPFEMRLARIAHVALYVLLFAIPLSGWALGSVEDEPLTFFGWFDLPRLVVGSEDTLEDLHETMFNMLVGLAVVHALGAVKHWIAGRRALPGH